MIIDELSVNHVTEREINRPPIASDFSWRSADVELGAGRNRIVGWTACFSYPEQRLRVSSDRDYLL
jgi:hypothetical protein